jgi:arsenate reductase-like glutaredoxin family protein
LRQRGVEFEAVDYAKQPLDEATVRSIVKLAGGVEPVLTRKWKGPPPTVDQFVKAVLKDVNTLRRPILVDGKKIKIGKDVA